MSKEDGRIINRQTIIIGEVGSQVLRDNRGYVRWKLKGNTDEENEKLGIRNVQGLFLERFPEFNELFPRSQDGKIAEELRENAEKFIINIAKRKCVRNKYHKIFGISSLAREVCPYFENSLWVALQKSFAEWGLNLRFEEFPPQNWMTLNALAKKIQRHPQGVRRFAEQLGEAHPEWFKNYFDPIGHSREHYSPDLIEIILKNNSALIEAPDGWLTNRSLAIKLKKSAETIKKSAGHFRGIYPEWFKKWEDIKGRMREHYSPGLISLIEQEILSSSCPPLGWKTRNSLFQELDFSEKSIKALAEQFRKAHPEWFMNYLAEGGCVREHYSPELIEEIRKLVDGKKKRKRLILPDEANKRLEEFFEKEEDE